MTHPFKLNGEQLSHGSVNRTLIVPLSSINIPEKYLGKTASSLLSSSALAREINKYKPESLYTTDEASIQALDNDLKSPVLDIHNAAEDICLNYGEKLAYLLLILKRGQDESLTRKDWKGEHWSYWAQRDRVILGGGLMAGEKGILMLKGLMQTFSNVNEALTIEQVQNPAYMGIFGLLKKSAIETGNVMLFDFGQTTIKSAFYRVENNVLMSTYFEKSTSVKNIISTRSGACDPVAALVNNIVQLVGDQWLKAHEEGFSPHTTIGISMSTYFSNHNPTSQNMYGTLALVSKDLQAYLKNRLSQHCSASITVLLMHDASAAAFPYITQGYGVLLTLGTAIGVGYFDQ